MLWHPFCFPSFLPFFFFPLSISWCNRRDKQARLSFWPGTELCVLILRGTVLGVLSLRSGFEKCSSVKHEWCLFLCFFRVGSDTRIVAVHIIPAYGTRWFMISFHFSIQVWCFCVIFSSAWFLIDTIASVRPVLFCFLFLRFVCFQGRTGQKCACLIWLWWFCLTCFFCHL